MHPTLQRALFSPQEPETRTWIDRVAAAGGVVYPLERVATDIFVRRCKENGIWTMFRRVNLCCGDFLASFVPLVNTVGATADTNNNLLASDYSLGLGWQTDGSTKWIDTGYTPTEATGGFGAYLRTDLTSSTQFIMGARNTANTQRFRIGYEVTTGLACPWGQLTTTNDGVSTLSKGFICSSRINSTDLRSFRNGGETDSEATATTPATPAATVGIFVQNIENGTQLNYCNSGTRVAGYLVHDGLGATGSTMISKMAVLNHIMQHFQQALGRAV
jgi:hypothetical protein